MPFLKVPTHITSSVNAHNKWLQLLKHAEDILKDDTDLQDEAAQGLHLKERNLPPLVLGRLYAEYCDIINRMYDSYLNSVHLQRAPYILELITVFMKRLYELRNELVHYITNDYIYVDDALIQMTSTPFDIQIIIPYHLPLECRNDSVEQLLQRMWVEAEKTKKSGKNKKKKNTIILEKNVPVQSETIIEIDESIPDVSEEFLNAVTIQRHERLRQYGRRCYISLKIKEAHLSDNPSSSQDMKLKAAALIQNIYRRYMELKRKRFLDEKRDILLGLIPDPFKKRLSYEEENNKIYERKRQIREKLQETYLRELQQENMRLIVYKKDNQIDDITEHVLNWFKEWYYGYGFFPEYPYDIEGGTMMVVRGYYPTIEEKQKNDMQYISNGKEKTKKEIKAAKTQAKADALLQEEIERLEKRQEAQELFKLRCNPIKDPGYQPQVSKVIGKMVQALQKYRASWSLYDDLPPDKYGDAVYGYMQNILTEDLMNQLHVQCRQYVDELMRLDLELLIEMQKNMFKRLKLKYPQFKARRMPEYTPPPKPLEMTGTVMRNLKKIFNLNIISKPTAKIKDIIGDLNYAAYEINLRDPDASFPSPGFGDIRRRLTLSCVFGSGIEPGAVRNKAVMLLGPQRNGKSFMVDAVCGELNAVKIDITPEVFSSVVNNPANSLAEVFLAARVFQPAVIYMRNIERVFAKEVPPKEISLKATALTEPLKKYLKLMLPKDKIIFIATCSNPFLTQDKPMVSLFSEIILVPRLDYNSLRLFFYERLQKIRSMPRDYCVQPLACVLQGYGFGVILEVFEKVMTAERIVRLNINPLSPAEFTDALFDMKIDATTLEEYQKYCDFFIKNSPLKNEREDFILINYKRDLVYKKLAKTNVKKT